MKVLIVEDSPEVLDTIQLCISMRWPSATFLSTARGAAASDLVESEKPDLLILDLGLPDVGGLEVLKAIRRFSDLPVVIVTALGDETSIVRGLELGADDYIVKPFSHTELLARVHAVLRRTQKPEVQSRGPLIVSPGLTIDLGRQQVLLDGHEISLTPTEWKLLDILVRNEGRTLSNEVLAERVWGSEYMDSSAIRVGVRRLRLKLGDDTGSPRIIQSRRGLGYKFVRPV